MPELATIAATVAEIQDGVRGLYRRLDADSGSDHVDIDAALAGVQAALQNAADMIHGTLDALDDPTAE